MTRDTLLLVTTSYPDEGDGREAAGSFVADLADRLAEHVPVRVVAPGLGGRETGGRVQVLRFRSPGRPLSLLSPLRPADWWPIVATLAALRRRTLDADRDGRIRHALALWVLPSGWAAAVLGRRAGIGYSVWALGSDIWSLGRLPIVRALLARTLRGAHARFADGLQLASDAAAIGGSPVEFLPSTRRSVRAGTPAARTAPWRLLFLGRWHPNKGIDLLLDALALLDDAAWARIGVVRIAGGGPLAPLVEARVAALAAQGRPMRLDGFLDPDAAADAIQDADWVLIPSRIESIPLVFSDAMKLRRPVVASPVGDLPGVVASEPACGVLAAAATAPAFAAALASAVADSPARYAEGTLQAARRFDLEAVVSRILAAVEKQGP